MIKSSELFQDQDKIIELARTARVAMYVLILVMALFYQLQFLSFLNFELLYPIYIVLALAFLSEFAVQWLTHESSKYLKTTLKFTFPLDVALISAILYSTQIQNSLFLFLYLYIIFFCGLVFRAKGAISLAIFTSILFSFYLTGQHQIEGQTRMLVFGINNMAFIVVAALSGYLSEQLYTLSSEILVQKKNLSVLKNINELIINNMQSGLMTLSLDYEIIQVNPSAATILGAKPSHLNSLGTLGSELIFILKTFRDQSDRSKQNIEIKYDFKGSEKLLDFSISKLFRGYDGLSAFVVIFQDVSERKRLEEKIKQKEKLAAIGQLAAGIAHEIRNPLASMSGSIQMLSQYVQKMDEEQVKLMNIALRETDRLNDLITEFLEYVRPDIACDEKVNVTNLLEDVLEMARMNKNLNKNIIQEKNMDSEIYIKGNFDKLKQVFLNIIINAYHAIDQRINGKIIVSALRHGDDVEVKIKDNGAGMSEDVKVRIFEPFFTTKPKGSGLGLAIVHKILEAHKADISIQSVENQGTEFTIRFQKWSGSNLTSNDSSKGKTAIFARRVT